jgi:tryptophanyl-tRNA synthetase
MTQYKNAKHKTGHILTYPVLMVHDICGYDEIIVGDDQLQHLELAKILIKRYNKTFNENIKIPIASPIAGKIMSLTDSSKKMSKSDPNGCLFLEDTEVDIRKKIRKAVMDVVGRQNLIDIYKRLGGIKIPELNLDLKNELSDLLVNKFIPV